MYLFVYMCVCIHLHCICWFRSTVFSYPKNCIIDSMKSWRKAYVYKKTKLLGGNFTLLCEICSLDKSTVCLVLIVQQNDPVGL